MLVVCLLRRESAMCEMEEESLELVRRLDSSRVGGPKWPEANEFWVQVPPLYTIRPHVLTGIFMNADRHICPPSIVIIA